MNLEAGFGSLCAIVERGIDLQNELLILAERQQAVLTAGQTLGLESPGEAAVLSIVTIPSDVRGTSANLLGPVVINAANRKAKQVILQNETCTTRHRLLDSPALTQAPAAVGASG